LSGGHDGWQLATYPPATKATTTYAACLSKLWRRWSYTVVVSIGMAGGDLHFSQRDSGLEGAHDERRAQHVRVHVAYPGSLGGRTDPTVGGTPVKPAAVVAEQDRTSGTFAGRQVDRPGCPRHQGNDRRLVALADDAQCQVTPLEAEVLDVGRPRLADPQAVQSEKNRKSGVGVVDPLGGEQKRPQLRAVETAGVGGVDLRPADVLGGVGGDPAIDVGEAVEAADGGQAPVDGGRRKAATLHGAYVELELGRLADRTTSPASAAHWKNARRSYRYASRVRPWSRARNAAAASSASPIRSSWPVELIVDLGISAVILEPPVVGGDSSNRLFVAVRLVYRPAFGASSTA